MDDRDLAHNEFPICPHCGHEDKEAWELFMNNEETIPIDCESCGRAYIVTCHVSVTYSTKPATVTP